MNRYTRRFTKLKEKDEIAFVPFTLLNFPNQNESFDVIKKFIDCGADMLELGIPYSDPVADGPIIQKASYQALENGSTTKNSFDLLEKVRAYDSEIPIGLLVYAQIIYAYGIDSFFKECQKIGIDSVLIADLPFQEKDEFYTIAESYHISLVFILAPNISEKIANELQEKSSAYVYVVNRSGITGHANSQSNQSPIRNAIKINRSCPHLLGFGISKEDHIEKAIQDDFDGVIIGSKIVSILLEKGNGIELENYLKEMKEATKLVRVPE